jgi:hypothetical protein
MFRALLFVCVVFGSAALGKGRINLQLEGGKGSAKVKAQLKQKLCKAYQCVRPTRGKTVPVDAVVYGAVNDGQLELKVFTDPSAPDVDEQYALAKKGTLAPRQLLAVVAALDGVLKAD